MKISCARDQLSTAFQLAGSVAQMRSPKEVLQNVKIEAGEDKVTLMATDMETGIRIDVEGVDVQTPGKALLHVGRVGMILRESSDEQLEFESDGSATVVKGQNSEFNLPSANPDEFPSVVGFEEEKYHELPARLFKEMVKRTAFATDPDSSRFALGGCSSRTQWGRRAGCGNGRSTSRPNVRNGQVCGRSRDIGKFDNHSNQIIGVDGASHWGQRGNSPHRFSR